MLFVASGAFQESKPSDMLAELQGRLPIRVELNGLNADDLRRILVEPKTNLVKQQVQLMSAEGVTLEITDDAVTEIANKAAEINSTVENIGARRLHTVLERIMEDISFNAPDLDKSQPVVVNAELVKEKLSGMLEKTDLKKFIL
ncbi:hslU [Symbiodinium sp. KB8]|nr:hslU [Symbiodinium sp. KB8]